MVNVRYLFRQNTIKSLTIVSAPAIPSAPADLELIAQLKSQLQCAELRIRCSLLPGSSSIAIVNFFMPPTAVPPQH